MTKSKLFLFLALFLWGCQPRAINLQPPAQMESFTQSTSKRAVRRANADIADEFLDFMFRTENGNALPIFTRFNEPVIISIDPNFSEFVQRELRSLIARIRIEAGIDITTSTQTKMANIYLHAIPLSTLQKRAPGATCFTVPNARSLREFKRNWRSGQSRWRDVTVRKVASIFIPSDQPPQVQRDCLHEELAQTLGPLNDLYRVPDSVFNDDNVRRVLTPYDMLILRITYAKELQNGMTQTQVATLLPRILKRLNPQGQRIEAKGNTLASEWSQIIGKTYRLGTPADQRIIWARKAHKLALTKNLGPHRTALSVIAQARVAQNLHPNTRANLYQQAIDLFNDAHGAGNVYSGIATQELAFTLFRLGQVNQAEAFLPQITKTANTLQDGELMFMALHLQAAIATKRGKTAKAKALVAQARGWGLYALGNHQRVAQIEQELGSLHPSVQEN
tara:strand:- start:11414 stop:12760 length:1347 start_codon:yes stop_codon:yes gene_type:complete